MKIDLKKRCKLFIVEILFLNDCWHYKEGEIVYSYIVAINSFEAEFKANNILRYESTWGCCKVSKIIEADNNITKYFIDKNLIKS